VSIATTSATSCRGAPSVTSRACEKRGNGDQERDWTLLADSHVSIGPSPAADPSDNDAVRDQAAKGLPQQPPSPVRPVLGCCASSPAEAARQRGWLAPVAR
jgi:hypothetical protein